jgi:hypothetical protein
MTAPFGTTGVARAMLYNFCTWLALVIVLSKGGSDDVAGGKTRVTWRLVGAGVGEGDTWVIGVVESVVPVAFAVEPQLQATSKKMHPSMMGNKLFFITSSCQFLKAFSQ